MMKMYWVIYISTFTLNYVDVPINTQMTCTPFKSTFPQSPPDKGAGEWGYLGQNIHNVAWDLSGLLSISVKPSIIRKYDGLFSCHWKKKQSHTARVKICGCPRLPHIAATKEFPSPTPSPIITVPVNGIFFWNCCITPKLIFATSHQTISTFDLYFFTCDCLPVFLMGQPCSVQNAPGYL